MSVACGGPDRALGVAIRLSDYLDCQARALGENGFMALVGGPGSAALLSATVTLLVALLGYRLLAGDRPDGLEATGRALRLGLVLALVTGWPAFQALVYTSAVEAPEELAATLLPAVELPSEALDRRVQAAYDTLRLGGTGPQASQATAAGNQDGGTGPRETTDGGAAATPGAGLGAGQVARPTTALVLVIGTVGLIASLKIATGFLLAIAPLAILCLLFDATLALFLGWLGTLAGAAIATLGAFLVTALELVVLESEIGALQSYSRGLVAGVSDTQALSLIVILFALMAVIVTLLALRITGRIAPMLRQRLRIELMAPVDVGAIDSRHSARFRRNDAGSVSARIGDEGPTRATMLAGRLTESVRREQASAAGTGSAQVAVAEPSTQSREGDPFRPAPAGLGVAGRRSAVRQTRSSMRRDGTR